MIGDQLVLKYDPQRHAAVLIATSLGGAAASERIALHEDFRLADVEAALLCTGCVAPQGEHWQFHSDIRLKSLRDLLEQMLGYFQAPGVPGSELLAVHAAVADYAAKRDLRPHIPWLAYAWLDCMVRDDLADEARSAGQIWSRDSLEVDCAAVRERRVSELLHRYANAPTSAAARLAPSLPTRRPAASREAKSG